MFSSRWDSAFCILQAWSKQYGHVNVPARAVWQPGTEQELNLGMWLSSQRKLHAKNLLSAERTSLLESVGVQWDGAVIRHDGNWSDALQRLTAYINASNGQRPPLEYVCEDGMQLGRWLAKQRGYWRTGSLKSERAASLAALGIGPDQSHSASLNTGLKSERRRGVRPSVQSTAMHEGSRQRSPNPRHLSLTPGPMVWLSAPHNQYVCALASHFFDARPDVWVGKRNRARLLRKDLT
ncbi:hypothetical protein LMG32289_06200 [Cupriavidus pampae]|uniref:Helicase-associated domain-containing protein n=2 Tax=Cupriavidus pampae TaxID=659251 RepID=A0ABM8XZV9_9BURK|nr:hypothetical protein LMG32289_06200 [Cupriavidus pampae]